MSIIDSMREFEQQRIEWRDEHKDYFEFMENPDNSHKCDKCPENSGFEGQCLPCGQQNCWVDCHCNLL